MPNFILGEGRVLKSVLLDFWPCEQDDSSIILNIPLYILKSTL